MVEYPNSPNHSMQRMRASAIHASYIPGVSGGWLVAPMLIVRRQITRTTYDAISSSALV
jgi:hypothetical protein